MCAVLIAVASFTTTTEAATTRQDIESQIKSFASLLVVAQTHPQYKNQIIEIVTKALMDLLVELKDLEKDKTSVTVNATVNKGDAKVTFKPKQGTLVNVDTSAKAISVDGDSNDYAEYEIEFDIRAFGNQSFISEDFDDSVEFVIKNASNGDVVYESDGPIKSGSVVASFSMGADIDGGFYRINEDDSEEINIGVTYTPGIAAEPGAYRLELKKINYRTNKNGSVQSFNTSSTSYRTSNVNLIN